MIKVTMSGKSINIIRSYEFKKGAPLSDYKLEVPYELKLTLAGIDPKAPAAKNIINAFPKAYEKAVGSAAKSRNSENDSIWKAAAKAISKGTDTKTVEKLTQDKLKNRWADFEKKVLIPKVDEVVADLAGAELDKMEAKKVVARSYLLSPSGIFEKIAIATGLQGVAGAATLTAAAGVSLAAFWPAMATMAAILGTLAVTRKLSEKVYTDININLKRVDKELDNVADALHRLDANLKTMDKQKEKLSYLMIKKEAELKKLEKEFKNFSLTMDKNVVALKQGNDLKTKIADLRKGLDEEKKERAKLVADTKTVSDLIKHSSVAKEKFKRDRSQYDKVLSFGEKFKQAINSIDDTKGSIEKSVKKIK